MKRWVSSIERNVETDNELPVSGGREFQSLEAMTEKALLPRDDSESFNSYLEQYSRRTKQIFYVSNARSVDVHVHKLSFCFI